MTVKDGEALSYRGNSTDFRLIDVVHQGSSGTVETQQALAAGSY
jgi:hypothetical protein